MLNWLKQQFSSEQSDSGQFFDPTTGASFTDEELIDKDQEDLNRRHQALKQLFWGDSSDPGLADLDPTTRRPS